MHRRLTGSALAMFIAMATSGCSDDAADMAAMAALGGGSLSIEGAGATFPQPLYKRWIETYTGDHPGVSISYEGIGSGAGIERFLAETVDFGASDAAMSDAAMAAVERGVQLVPMTAGMVVLAYNLPGIDGQLKLPRAVIADIFAGKLDYWDDPRIAEANPGLELPHRNISPVVRRDSSGTTFLMTNHLGAADAWWGSDEGPGVGKQVDWPGPTMEVNYNEGVAQRVKVAEGAIGYMEYEFAERLGLPIAALQNQAGQFVAPSPAAGTAALASADRIPDDLRVFVPDPPGSDAYPIAGYTWLLLYGSYPDQDKAQVLKDFVTWALEQGQGVAEEMGYIPLPDEMVRLAKAKVEAIR